MLARTRAHLAVHVTSCALTLLAGRSGAAAGLNARMGTKSSESTKRCHLLCV